jgi:hypothetical protein
MSVGDTVGDNKAISTRPQAGRKQKESGGNKESQSSQSVTFRRVEECVLMKNDSSFLLIWNVRELLTY